MTKRSLTLLTLVILAITSCNKYKIVSQTDAVLYIRPNATYQQVKDSLQGILSNSKAFFKYADNFKLEEKFKPGKYKIPAGTKSNYLANMLSHGWQQPVRLVLSGNIRGAERLSAKLGEKLGYDSLAFIEALTDAQNYTSYGFDSANFTNMIIPNTYEVYWDITPNSFLKKMKQEYDRFWDSSRVAKAKELGLTQNEVSVLASIVCEESNYNPELPSIAGVYINRLKAGIKLDADPTVKFAHKDQLLKRILFKHLEIESPYNTYKYAGLPPGPITIPSVAGIDAVLNYARHNYYYFCASDKLDGTHKFATNLSEHNRNARAYQTALMKLPADKRN